ncbi:MAG: hypothetical protein V3W41_22175 [Planctomycetota bacterium]
MVRTMSDSPKPADSVKLVDVEIQPHPEGVAAGRRAAAAANSRVYYEGCAQQMAEPTRFALILDAEQAGAVRAWQQCSSERQRSALYQWPRNSYYEESEAFRSTRSANDALVAMRLPRNLVPLPDGFAEVEPASPLPMRVVLVRADGYEQWEDEWLCQWADGEDVSCIQHEGDATYIVTACNERPALRARLAELEAENERLRHVEKAFRSCSREEKCLRDQRDELRDESERLRATVRDLGDSFTKLQKHDREYLRNERHPELWSNDE